MSLSKYRKTIDQIDKQLVALINERHEVARKIGENKRARKAPVFSAARENAVYERAVKNNSGPTLDRTIRGIYREIMSGALALEEDLKIAYLGPMGTFSYSAAMSKFGSSVSYLPCSTLEDVSTSVDTKRTHYGLVPVENSLEGGINVTLDMLLDKDLKIVSEVYLRIRLAFLAKSKGKISKVFSHPQPFAQCRRWLSANYPDAELHKCPSTVFAAKKAVRTKNSAAIAHEDTANLYNLNILDKHIEDSSANFTRFLVIAKDELNNATGHDKTSIIVFIHDKPGALHDMLSIFKKNRINLTRIESRPMKSRTWEYCFFIDFDGHYEDSKGRKALQDIEKKAFHVKLLGSYPKADTEGN